MLRQEEDYGAWGRGKKKEEGKNQKRGAPMRGGGHEGGAISNGSDRGHLTQSGPAF